MAAQPPLRRLPPAGPSWTDFRNLSLRVEAVEAQNHSLRQQLAEHPPTLTKDGAIQASYCDRCYPSDCSCDSSQACELDCGWIEQLNAKCKEGLSWNTASGWRIVPFGQLRGEGIYSSAPQTADAIIIFLNPNNPGIDEDQATVHAKTSQLNFALTGPDLGNWQTGGLVRMNFLGPEPLRIQTGANIANAYGEIQNGAWRVAFGRMYDLFGPISPTTVNQINQRGAGNIGIYRGAVHLDRFVTPNDVQQWTLSGRISQQDINDYALIPEVRGTDNGWPNIEARAGLALGPESEFGRPFEIGLSGVIGEVREASDRIIAGAVIQRASSNVEQTRGACLDLQLEGERLGFRGEAWWGKAAGTYFVATLQSLNPMTDQAIESVGGWGSVYYKINPCVTAHLGFGVDDPRNADLGFIDPMIGVGQISYNEVAWGNIMWDVTEFFQLALEISHRRTDYLALDAADEGMLYHFASVLYY